MTTYSPAPPLTEYAVGDLIVFETFEGEKRLVCVTEKTENIRYGHPGFLALTVDDGTHMWGYDVQVEHVQESAADILLAGLNDAHAKRLHEMGDRRQAREWADKGCEGCTERITTSRW